MLGRAVRCFNVVDEGAHLPLSLAGSRWEEALVALIQRAGTNSICYCQHWDLRGKKDIECQKRKCNQRRVYDDDKESLPTLSCSSMELRMISAASRAIWSWVSMTGAPWSMITTICFDCGPYCRNIHRPANTQKQRFTVYLFAECRNPAQRLFLDSDGKKPSVVLAWFPLIECFYSVHYSVVKEILHSIVLFLETLFNYNTVKKLPILPKSHIYIL